MEVTALCFRLMMLQLILLRTQAQNSYTQKTDADFLRVTPNRLQYFHFEPVSFECVGFGGLSDLRVIRDAEEFKPVCDIKRTSMGSFCRIERAYPSDSGEYWCETKEGERSSTVNITVTAGSVILESPALSVVEGDSVTLSCRNKTKSTNLQADFYKDGQLIHSSPAGEMIINNVSKSSEGFYKCTFPSFGTSPESWLTVTDGSVILESPALPAMEGDSVSLRCRDKRNPTNLRADFYKDGTLIHRSPAGEMTINNVSRSDEGLYRCSISGSGDSAESRLTVTALHRETCPPSSHIYLIIRTVFTIVMVALLLLLLGLMHCGKLRVTHR
ncbi:low affinity immunoglobulin gamma Fc region receptor II-a isoform X2 [Lates calcarifer]|uniref:low affinity immunoglobulin gamma Fc region receptor II-a isoform X2 n=1 Tax=Lates calcarifer TaxID=8187 RepID=UPI0021D7C494|nr:low affinity immunoglobulin gamma Fc region receptor II-a isoform X2 [Lates calcarifer]